MDSAVTGNDMTGKKKQGARGPRVVVVGAGLAGVGAVRTLREGGIRDVILLEARDRPGGRVQTVPLEDGFVEMGAQFLHGRNEVFDIAEREDMLAEDSVEKQSLPDTLLQFRPFTFQTPDGATVSPVVVTHNLQVLEQLLEDASDAVKEGDLRQYDVNVSLGDYFRANADAVKRKMTGSEEVKDAMLRWVEHWEHQDAGGAVDHMSLSGNAQYDICPGNGTRGTRLGMEAVFKCLLRDSVPAGCLRLNKPVKAIHWSAGRPDLDPSEEVAPAVVMVDEEKAFSESEYRTTKNPSGNNALIAAVVVTGKNEDDEEVCFKSEFRTNQHCFNNNVFNRENLEKETTRLNGLLQHGDIYALGSRSADLRNGGNSSSSISSSGIFAQEKGDRPAAAEVARGDKASEDTDPNGALTAAGYNVTLQCADGDVFQADHVIVTSSIGFLRSNLDIFQPRLSSRHEAAIEGMGFGNVAKMFLIWEAEKGSFVQNCCPCMPDVATEWRRRMLGSDVEGVIPLWLEGADTQLKSAKHVQKMSNGRHWYQDVCHIQTIESHAFCLVAWVAGEAAITMESLPGSEVSAVVHELLASFLGKPDLPKPCRFIRTEWHSNPYTRGAYSYLATGVPLELHDVLRQPLPSAQMPTVQLAGEACSKNYFSTAHGALLSGQQAARAILHHHKMIPQ